MADRPSEKWPIGQEDTGATPANFLGTQIAETEPNHAQRPPQAPGVRSAVRRHGSSRRIRDGGGALYTVARRAFTQPLGGSFDRVLRVWILSCIWQLCDAWNVGEFGLKRLPR